MDLLIDLLANNALLIIGLLFGAALIGLKKIAAKTENKIDDQLVEKIEENKASLVKKVAELFLKVLKRKKK